MRWPGRLNWSESARARRSRKKEAGSPCGPTRQKVRSAGDLTIYEISAKTVVKFVLS
jgi:hypothetical protein